ncbi:hypothetical protein AMTR_s00050p00132250 [Amborella trichopoda]|uniref:Uncharacterized protein n=1 Tax=Amborella trichopoda TaxID=13333 RepID=W1PS81_AMBTC|nr:hypothetical protein AMTR_s00050p00132250 [Amborella trichopoda]
MAAEVWGTADDQRAVMWSSWRKLVVEVKREAEERGLVSMKDGKREKGRDGLILQQQGSHH